MSYFQDVTSALSPSLLSAFGTLETGEMTPVVALDFVYGINVQTGTSSVTGTGATVDTNLSRLRLQSGTNAAGHAEFASRYIVRYRAGQGCTARFTCVFATGTVGNTQIVGVGSATNGYFFGYDGATFGILHRNGGADTWIPQSSWNGDLCDGTGASGFDWNPQLGNVMQIKYPYLGFGTISFYVEDPKGTWILCHTIQYPNSSQLVQVTNPSLNFYVQTLNAGNTSNLTMYVGSVGIFISGPRSYSSNPKWAYDNGKSGIAGETTIFSLRNCTTYNGITNRGLLRIHSLSVALFAASGNSWGILRLRIGATIGGSPSYATINRTTADNGVTITSGNSITSADVAGTTATGGTMIQNIALAQGNLEIDVTAYNLFVAPGEILTVSGSASASSTIAASVNWSEDI
jgi:hypothetical protein